MLQQSSHSPVTSLCWNPDGTVLLSAFLGTLWVFPAMMVRYTVQVLQQSSHSPIVSLCWNPDGKILLSASPAAWRRTYVTSRDFNDRVHVLVLEILCDSGKTLFNISVKTGQICMRFEADTPQKLSKYAHLTKFPDKKLI